MQRHVRMMPTNLVASMLLLHRKGICEEELEKRVKWLGQDLQQRGIMLSTEGLPSTNTLKIGLTHLKDYLNHRRDIIEPGIIPYPKMDYKNILMLGYYRNPLNHVYFNEGVISVSMLSFSDKKPWDELSGITPDDLYQRAAFLSSLLKREEVLKHRLHHSREAFDQTLQYMLQRKVLQSKNGQVSMLPSMEALVVFAASLVWPMVDSYYATLLFCLSLVKNKSVEASQVSKRVQWLGESLFEEKTIMFFEACNQESIKNAVNELIEMKVLQRTSVFL